MLHQWTSPLTEVGYRVTLREWTSPVTEGETPWMHRSLCAGTSSVTGLDHTICTGKNDLTRRVTHREAVFGMVIHSIFDMWHCDILWTYALTRLLWYACDFVHWILYITLHTIHHAAYYTLESKVLDALHARSQVCSEVHSGLRSIARS